VIGSQNAGPLDVLVGGRHIKMLICETQTWTHVQHKLARACSRGCSQQCEGENTAHQEHHAAGTNRLRSDPARSTEQHRPPRGILDLCTHDKTKKFARGGVGTTVKQTARMQDVAANNRARVQTAHLAPTHQTTLARANGQQLTCANGVCFTLADKQRSVLGSPSVLTIRRRQLL
jgi:hypothetical protein